MSKWKTRLKIRESFHVSRLTFHVSRLTIHDCRFTIKDSRNTMVDIKDINKVYFLGIGGIGMSALARYFKFHGKEVSGYDKTETPLTRQLVSEGIPVHYDDNLALAPKDAQLIV